MNECWKEMLKKYNKSIPPKELQFRVFKSGRKKKQYHAGKGRMDELNWFNFISLLFEAQVKIHTIHSLKNVK